MIFFALLVLGCSSETAEQNGWVERELSTQPTDEKPTEAAALNFLASREKQRDQLTAEIDLLMEQLISELKNCETVHYYVIPGSIDSVIYGIDKSSTDNPIIYPHSYEKLKTIAVNHFHQIQEVLNQHIRQGPELKRAAATYMMIRSGKNLLKHHPYYSESRFCGTFWRCL